LLHVTPGFPGATLTGILHGCWHTVAAFDCIVLTQTLPFIYDLTRRGPHRSCAAAGGVLLADCARHYSSQPSGHGTVGGSGELTSLAARRLLKEAFRLNSYPCRHMVVCSAAVAFLYGLAAEELTSQELDYADADFEV